jgi:hypothetical protein
MEGSAFDSQLVRSGRAHFAVATQADDAAIRRLLRDNPMRGAIDLTFEREPDYSRSAKLAGGRDQTIVGYVGDRLACVGRCTQRRCWVNGCESRAGYLAELRLDQSERGRFGLLRDGYRFFHELQRDAPADLYFTSIVADNERARRLLERGVRGLPAYSYLAGLDTVLVAVPGARRRSKLHVEFATPDLVPDMLDLLNSGARRRQLAAVWDRETLLSLDEWGLPLSRWRLAFDGGDLVACGALWDQRAFRQTVIRGYSMPLSLARPLLNAAAGMLGWPRLPRPGSILPHAFLSPLAFADGAETILPEFVETFFDIANQAGIKILTLALPPDDARLPVLRRRHATRTWRSRLYRIDWPGNPICELEGTILPDVSLL